MVVFLNILLPLIIALALYIGYKTKKLVTAILISIVIGFGYSLIQPSYIPKGTVPPMHIIESAPVDKAIEDRMRKTMSGDERDARMEKQKEESAARREVLMQPKDPA